MPHTTSGIRSEIKDTDRVDFKSIYFREMIRKWETIQALREGSEAMREGRERWLPKMKEEPLEKYDVRLERSVLFPGLDGGIRGIVAKPFSHPVTVVDEDNLGERTQVTLEDTDGAGKSFHEFAREVFDVGNQFGMCHVIVDFPQTATVVEGKDGETEVVTPNLAEEREAGIAPRLVVVRPDQMFGHRAEGTVLTMVRIFEQDLRDDGLFGEVLVNVIRVIGVRQWQVWEQEVRQDSESENKNKSAKGEDEGEFKLVAEGEHTFGAVPLLTYYVKQTAFMESEPTHEHLADINVTHWQSQSDQRNILHVARVPVMFAAGFEEEEIEAGIVVGSQSLVASRNDQATLEYVEHTGAAIEAGRQDLKDLEDQMRVLGLQPMLPHQSGDVKATGLAIDEAQGQSEVQSWIRVEELFLLRVIRWIARWVDEKVPDKVSVQIFNDFTIGLLGDKDSKTLLEMRLSGQIDHETYLIETKRRGMIREDADIEAIIAAVEAEGPPMGEDPPEPEPEPEPTDGLSPAGRATDGDPHTHTSGMPNGTAGEPHTHPQPSSCGVRPDGTPVTNPHQHTTEFPDGEACE